MLKYIKSRIQLKHSLGKNIPWIFKTPLWYNYPSFTKRCDKQKKGNTVFFFFLICKVTCLGLDVCSSVGDHLHSVWDTRFHPQWHAPSNKMHALSVPCLASILGNSALFWTEMKGEWMGAGSEGRCERGTRRKEGRGNNSQNVNKVK